MQQQTQKARTPVPCDHGSVENLNKLVKRVLGSVLAERRELGEHPNWTEVLGSVASTINSQCGSGKNDVPSFELGLGLGLVYIHSLA
ncbi:MAG: hypothetical protein RL463_133 [Bacteroidota bacterium]|jgi:hypothetical protein